MNACAKWGDENVFSLAAIRARNDRKVELNWSWRYIRARVAENLVRKSLWLPLASSMFISQKTNVYRPSLVGVEENFPVMLLQIVWFPRSQGGRKWTPDNCVPSEPPGMCELGVFFCKCLSLPQSNLISPVYFSNFSGILLFGSLSGALLFSRV